jgi:hypothetical protein
MSGVSYYDCPDFARAVVALLQSPFPNSNAEKQTTMLGRILGKTEPLLDAETIQWQFDTFAWALRQFDAEVFYDETTLVLPDNAHFPGRSDSPQAMADLIFNHVKQYAGVGHWPTRVIEQNACGTLEAPKVEIAGNLRGSGGEVVDVAEEHRLPVLYNEAMLSSPETLIASFAHTLAHYLGSMSDEEPPGGLENWPHITELLAVFMGFGVIFANDAYNFRAGCGSCSSPAAERENYLSQHDITYALAIFTVLKSIPPKQVARHLKKTLRAFFNRAVKDVSQRTGMLQPLSRQALASAPAMQRIAQPQ